MTVPLFPADRRPVRAALIALLAAALLSVAAGVPAGRQAGPGRGSGVPRAAVTAVPADAGRGAIQGSVTPTPMNLPRLGYLEREFLVSGTADSYAPVGALGPDGRWSVTPSVRNQPYRTRIVVRRPADPARFNGTVVVEWLNVSFGADIPVEWGQSWEQFTRAGYAYVGVSAQQVGITRLTTFDPGRYGTLTSPGDGASYDIFSQAARAVRDQSRTVLGGLRPRRVLAAGHSQSAGRLVTYADAIQPRSRAFDGFLIHGRGPFGAPLGDGFAGPAIAPIRSDLGVPVMQVQSETDLQVFSPARQPDTNAVRTWEIAGTSHADKYLTDGLDVVNARERITNNGAPITCDRPLNSFPYHWASNAAYAALDRWVRTGAAPARGTPFTTSRTTLVRDARGNVQGGVRLPDITAPIATYGPTNTGGNVPGACLLLGSTTPFDAATLAALYPTRGAYLRAYLRSTQRALRSGFMLRADARAALALAAHRRV